MPVHDMEGPVDAGIPTWHEVKAAFRVAQVIGERASSKIQVRSAYPRTVTGGLYSPTDLQRGEKILVLSELVQDQGDCLKGAAKLTHLASLDESEGAKLILKLFLQKRRPVWMSVAVGNGRVREEYIPDRALRVLNTAFPSTRNRNSVLFGLLSSSNQANYEAIGEAGEEHVVSACRTQRYESGYAELAEQVRQVSKISDRFGYDIAAPCPGDDYYHMEVKTVGKDIEALRFYLSRNQFEVGLGDPYWRLVICKKEVDHISIVGWCGIETIEEGAPEEVQTDSRFRVRWEKLRVRLREQLLDPGLPPLKPGSTLE